MSDHVNRTRIQAVANRLGELNEKWVFVGGATLSFYADELSDEVRPTDDIDVIIELAGYVHRAELEEKLRDIGFEHDVKSGIICRFKCQGIIVDIMSTSDDSIGGENIWYPDGLKHAIDHQVDDTCLIKILHPVYFLATKIEAFKDRGQSNGLGSKDFEDIVYILENRATIWEELDAADEKVKTYLQTEFGKLLANQRCYEWLDANVERGDEEAAQRIIDGLVGFVEGKG